MTNTDTMIDSAPQAEEVETSDEQLWQTIRDESDDDNQDDDPIEADADDKDEGSPDPSDDDDGDDSEGADGADPEALQKQIERLQHSLASEKGRTQASRKEIERLKSEVSEAQTKAHRTPEDDDRLKASKERLDAAKEEYGDVIGPLADTVEDLTRRFDELSKLEQRDLTAKTDRLAELKAAQESIFEKEHPDGYDLITREQAAFAAWVDDQPADLRQIYQRNKAEIIDGAEAAYLVGMFKQSLHDATDAPAKTTDTNRLSARRARQIDGARASRAQTQQRVASVPPKDSENADAHWDYFARKEKERERRG